MEKAAAMWGEVDDVLVKAVVAADPPLQRRWRRLPPPKRGEPVRSCFQIFGFDVMFDAKPWLLEVNCDPALGPTRRSTSRSNRICSSTPSTSSASRWCAPKPAKPIRRRRAVAVAAVVAAVATPTAPTSMVATVAQLPPQ